MPASTLETTTITEPKFITQCDFAALKRALYQACSDFITNEEKAFSFFSKDNDTLDKAKNIQYLLQTKNDDFSIWAIAVQAIKTAKISQYLIPLIRQENVFLAHEYLALMMAAHKEKNLTAATHWLLIETHLKIFCGKFNVEKFELLVSNDDEMKLNDITNQINGTLEIPAPSNNNDETKTQDSSNSMAPQEKPTPKNISLDSSLDELSSILTTANKKYNETFPRKEGAQGHQPKDTGRRRLARIEATLNKQEKTNPTSLVHTALLMLAALKSGADTSNYVVLSAIEKGFITQAEIENQLKKWLLTPSFSTPGDYCKNTLLGGKEALTAKLTAFLLGIYEGQLSQSGINNTTEEMIKVLEIQEPENRNANTYNRQFVITAYHDNLHFHWPLLPDTNNFDEKLDNFYYQKILTDFKSKNIENLQRDSYEHIILSNLARLQGRIHAPKRPLYDTTTYTRERKTAKELLAYLQQNKPHLPLDLAALKQTIATIDYVNDALETRSLGLQAEIDNLEKSIAALNELIQSGDYGHSDSTKLQNKQSKRRNLLDILSPITIAQSELNKHKNALLNHMESELSKSLNDKEKALSDREAALNLREEALNDREPAVNLKVNPINDGNSSHDDENASQQSSSSFTSLPGLFGQQQRTNANENTRQQTMDPSTQTDVEDPNKPSPKAEGSVTP